ncbi:MAG: sugar phosphate isomerase/epimerase [Caldilineaceae bacterium]|nr:sugar phosphate isomerase/epimerase [Caldilineaceae bacterium]
MDLEDALREISALGFKCVELNCHEHLGSKIRDDIPVSRTKKLLDEFDLVPAALMGGSDFAVSDSKLDAMLALVGKQISYCGALGAPILRVFAGHIRAQYVDGNMFDRTIRNLRRIMPVAEENGVRLAFENHFGITATVDDVARDDVARIVEGVASPWLGVNYDPANFVPVGVDPIEAGRQLAPYIIHCHLKDAVYVGSTSYSGYAYLEAGAGIVDYPRVIELLSDIDFQGFLSLEYESIFDPVRGTRQGLANLRHLMAA